MTQNTITAPSDADEDRRIGEALHALANLVERRGNLPLAVKISQAADEAAPYVAYTDAEIRQIRRTRRGGVR